MPAPLARIVAQPGPVVLERLNGWLGQAFAEDRLPGYAWTAGLAALVVAAVAVGYALLARTVSAAERTGRLPISVGFALRKVLRWLAVVLAAVALLSVLGVFESVFAATAGVLTLVAAGFVAFWSVLSNLFCAIILLAVRPFRLGDRLTFPAENLSGTVTDFNLVFTHLRTAEGRILQVPNNLFFQKMFLLETGERTADLARSLEGGPKPAADEAPRDLAATDRTPPA